MKLQDFTEFQPFNELRQKMAATKLGYFELFDPKVHLTGLERSELELSGRLLALEDVKILPDKTLAIKNSRVLVYYPDENWYRDQREFPTYHLAYCSQLDESAKANPSAQWLATTRIGEDYDLLKFRSSGQVTLVSHGFAVCKHCLHTLRYKNFDEFRNRRRGYSETVLNQFRLDDFFRLYQQYPLSFKSGPKQEE
jgi:hypothetical protein